MTNKRTALDFHLFDGEGGSSGDGGYGADASAFLEANGISDLFRDKSKSESGETRVEYGRPKDEDKTSQVGSDTDSGAEDIAKEWEALVGKGGRFHDLYGQGVSEAVQQRFKNQADLQGQVDKIGDDLMPLFLNYGLKAGDFEGLKNAIANDENFYKAGAERAGLDIEQYKNNLKLQADAERGRQITEAYEQQQRENEMFAQWEADADNLKQSFPAFDLGLEIENFPEFAKLLDNGVDVRTAFLTVHMDEILAGANAEARTTATQDVVSRIQQRASRPAEAGLRRTPAIEYRSDPSKLKNEDMDEIMRIAMEGGSIAF